MVHRTTVAACLLTAACAPIATFALHHKANGELAASLSADTQVDLQQLDESLAHIFASTSLQPEAKVIADTVAATRATATEANSEGETSDSESTDNGQDDPDHFLLLTQMHSNFKNM